MIKVIGELGILKSILLLAIVFIVAGALIILGSLKWVRVTKETIAIQGLEPGLEGLKVLQITDLHANNPQKMNVNIWKSIEKLDFDIVLITGDIVKRNAAQLEPHMESIAALASKKPVFFGEGNHDHREFGKISEMLEQAGVTVLLNEKLTMTYKGSAYEIVGLGDANSTNYKEALPLLEESTTFRLIMLHQPQVIDQIPVSHAPSFVLCGHTHGGQIRLPFFPTLYAPHQGYFPQYGYGLFEIEDSKMFISKGIGHSIIPIRFWNRPEICVFTITGNT